MAGDRQWYPEILCMDEILPAHEDRPERWLGPGEKGRTEIRFEPQQAEPDAVWSPGDRVTFKWFRELGTAMIAILPGGEIARPLRCLATPDLFTGEVPTEIAEGIPAEANWFWSLDDSDYCGGSIEEFAEGYAEGHGIEPGGEDVPVCMGQWSDPIPFIISPDGRSLLPAGDKPQPDATPQAQAQTGVADRSAPRPEAPARREDKENPC